MILKTKDYEMFSFRNDNRAAIDQAHVNKIAESIKARNLLELRPILVNKEFEVIDGQNRLLAAKMLGVEIYYEVKKDLKAGDILLLNTAKSWTMNDYHNYYCKNGYLEYQKLEAFMKENQLNLKIALNMTIGFSKQGKGEFKAGNYKFDSSGVSDHLEICWKTIDLLRKLKGFSGYMNAGKFWNALLRLVKHHRFDEDKWLKNIQRMVERFGPRANSDDYCTLFMDVFNYRNDDKINIREEEDV